MPKERKKTSKKDIKAWLKGMLPADDGSDSEEEMHDGLEREHAVQVLQSTQEWKLIMDASKTLNSSTKVSEGSVGLPVGIIDSQGEQEQEEKEQEEQEEEQEEKEQEQEEQEEQDTKVTLLGEALQQKAARVSGRVSGQGIGPEKENLIRSYLPRSLREQGIPIAYPTTYSPIFSNAHRLAVIERSLYLKKLLLSKGENEEYAKGYREHLAYIEGEESKVQTLINNLEWCISDIEDAIVLLQKEAPRLGDHDIIKAKIGERDQSYEGKQMMIDEKKCMEKFLVGLRKEKRAYQEIKANIHQCLEDAAQENYELELIQEEVANLSRKFDLDTSQIPSKPTDAKCFSAMTRPSARAKAATNFMGEVRKPPALPRNNQKR